MSFRNISSKSITNSNALLTNKVIGCAIEVHRLLGPGLLESTYEKCLVHELNLSNLKVRHQISIPVFYKGFRLDCGYRADLLVEETLLVELTSVEKLLPLHEAQIITYLKLTNLSLGLIINFNVVLLKYGIRRLSLTPPYTPNLPVKKS